MKQLKSLQDLCQLKSGTKILNIRKGYISSLDSAEHIDIFLQISSMNIGYKKSYNYINKDGKSYNCYVETLFSNFDVYSMDSDSEVVEFNSKYSFKKLSQVHNFLINGPFDDMSIYIAAMHLVLDKATRDIAFRKKFLDICEGFDENSDPIKFAKEFQQITL